MKLSKIESDDNELFKSRIMQNIIFEDLTIVIGKPYIYRHQEVCDHMIVFKDIR